MAAALPSIISGGAGLLGNIFSGIFGNSSNRRTNSTNLKIAQMNNEWNSMEAAKNREYMTGEREAQNEWNLEQWLRMNDYNSAASQRARLEEAGLNPYMMMSGGSSGVATSSPSSVQPNTSHAPTAQPVTQVPYDWRFDFSSISEAINSYFTNREIAARTTGQDISNSIESQLGKDFRLSQIAQNVEGRYELLSPEYQALRYREAPNMAINDLEQRRQTVEGMKATNELSRAQRSLAYLQVSAQRTLNKYMDVQQQADLWIKTSQVYENFASGNLSLEAAKTHIKQQLLIQAETRGKKISNRVLEETANGIIRAYNEENEYNADYYKTYKEAADRLANWDIRIADLNKRIIEHEERISRANRQWRHVDKTTSQIGNLLGGFAAGASGVKNLSLSRYLRNKTTSKGWPYFE